MLENFILASLPVEELADISGSLRPIRLQPHEVLYSGGEPVEHAYFVDSGVVCLLAIGKHGGTVETGIIGREGLVGASGILGSGTWNAQVVVQTAGVARRLPTAEFLASFEKSSALRSLIYNHLDFLLFQAQQNGLCHALHSIEERLCRWLLQTSDAGSGDVVEITQEVCAHILGVQRTSLSMVAHALQEAGCIRTLRGKISILDRFKLEDRACECYGKLKQHRPGEAHPAARSLLHAQQLGEAVHESGRVVPATYGG